MVIIGIFYILEIQGQNFLLHRILPIMRIENLTETTDHNSTVLSEIDEVLSSVR